MKICSLLFFIGNSAAEPPSAHIPLPKNELTRGLIILKNISPYYDDNKISKFFEEISGRKQSYSYRLYKLLLSSRSPRRSDISPSSQNEAIPNFDGKVVGSSDENLDGLWVEY